jgi:hypothetical protein
MQHALSTSSNSAGLEVRVSLGVSPILEPLEILERSLFILGFDKREIAEGFIVLTNLRGRQAFDLLSCSQLPRYTTANNGMPSE